MATREAIINIIGILPQNRVQEAYSYLSYLQAQAEKDAHNAEYSAMLDESFRQIEEGKVVVKTMEELEEMAK
ncbi:MAG: hypothetical protein FWH20_04065 [Oscillospiraceae bacterium]|nr:hypothetical protein [Oscillospiraceae bacterium]